MGLKWVLIVMLGAGIATATPTMAVSLKNADDRSYDITVIEKGQRTSFKVEPGGVLDKLCDKDCLVTLVGVPDGVYAMEGNEKVTIEKGLVYYTEPYVNRGKPEDFTNGGDAGKGGAKSPKVKPTTPDNAPKPSKEPSGTPTPQAK